MNDLCAYSWGPATQPRRRISPDRRAEVGSLLVAPCNRTLLEAARPLPPDEHHCAQLAPAMLAARYARCCGTPSARIELAAPGGFPSGGSSGPASSRARLPVPAGPGLGRRGTIRPSAGHILRLARRESLRGRARVPVRARRRQQRGDDRRRRCGQEEPHPVRPVHDRRGSGCHPRQPLTRLPAGRWTG